MKKVIGWIFFAVIALNSPTVLASEPKATASESSKTSIQTDQSQLTGQEMQGMVARVYEIRDMDKSNLTLEQKKGLKKELKNIKAKLENQKDPVVFVASGSAVLLIIILLIILL